jgi:hypothetical protein
MVSVRHLGLLGGGALWPIVCGALEEMVGRGALGELRSLVGASCGALAACALAARLAARMDREQLVASIRRDVRCVSTRHLLLEQPGADFADALEYGAGVFRADGLACCVRCEMRDRLGHADATLSDLRDASGVDVGVVVLESGRLRLLDASSHPALPVWVAVRASCAVSPLVSAVRLRGGEAWWLDPGLRKGYSRFVLDAVRGRGGRYAVVSPAGDGLPRSWCDLPHRPEASLADLACIWAMSMLLTHEHGLRGDPWAVCVTTHASFMLNFGIFPACDRALAREGARAARAHLRRWRAWPAAARPDGLEEKLAAWPQRRGG